MPGSPKLLISSARSSDGLQNDNTSGYERGLGDFVALIMNNLRGIIFRRSIRRQS
jgi:hypothetical protein